MGNKCEGCKWVNGGWKDEINPCEDCSQKELKNNFEPAEPVVLSAREMLEILKISIRDSSGFLEEGCYLGAIERAHQNGRLERDLEVRGLVDAVKNYHYNQPTWDKIQAELFNLKPLNKD